jgi:hypothetical protein
VSTSALINKPESAQILVKQGKLILKRADGEFPITKIGNCRFSIIKPSESEAEEFVLVPGANGKVEYLHMERRALRKVQEAADKKRTAPEIRTDVKSED